MIAKRSILIALVFGFISIFAVIFTGHGSAQEVADKQPMKLAAMEGLYQGKEGCDLVAVGVLNHDKEINDGEDPYVWAIPIPNMLSWLSYGTMDAYVPGIEDLINGNESYGILSADERMDRGNKAVSALAQYKVAQKEGNTEVAEEHLKVFRENEGHFGYGYIEKKEDLIPHVPLTFYSFHYMVASGFLYVLLFMIFVWLIITNKIDTIKFRKP